MRQKIGFVPAWCGVVQRGVIILVLVSLALIGIGPTAPLYAQGPDGITPAALNQMAALLTEKQNRTPAQQKIDSNLLYAFKQSHGQAVAAGVAGLKTGVVLDEENITIVDITAPVSEAFLARLRALGATIIYAHVEFRSVRAAIPIAQVETIAGWSEVIFIQPKQEAMTSGIIRSLSDQAAAAASREAAVSPPPDPVLPPNVVAPAHLPALAATQGFTPTSPSNSSGGDVAHRANLVRNRYGYLGLGVKACVLSDGVDSLARLQASGDLPANVTVVPGQAGSGDEGAAMLEIVYDLAPGAQLFYATGFNGVASFAQNILDLRNVYGCNIIIDDVIYFIESPFQLGQAPGVNSTTNGGLVSQAINTVTASGALFFSSAGNSGNFNDGTSGVWEGDFANGGPAGTPIPGAGTLHDFQPGAGVTAYNTITSGSFSPLTLFWADPLGSSANDYDLFLLNSTGTSVFASSTNIQNGTQDPWEAINVGSGTGERVVVVQRPGAANRYLHLNTNRGRLGFGTPGQTYGHNAAVPAFTVAAASTGSPAVPFSPTTTGETFSSDGPRRYFFNPNSTPVTPGNFSSSGGSVVQKPDLTAADEVSTAAPGFDPFPGTSAAAPHAGAIAALLLSAKPGLTPAQIRTILTTTPAAIDIELPGVDRDTGAGVLDALAMLQSVNPAPVPLLTLSNLTASEGTLKNNNGVIEPGESVSITELLTNLTLAPATNVQVTLGLISPPPGILVISGPVNFGTLATNGGSFSNTATPHTIYLAPTMACGTLVNFKLTAAYGSGGSNSPQVFLGNFRLGTPLEVTTTLDTTPPASEPGLYTATSGTQTGRLVRDGVVATCAAAKDNPGLASLTGARRYDAYTLTNTSAGPTCMTVSLNQPGSGLYTAVYNSNGFVPAAPDTNYLADPGTFNSPYTYSFEVAAGQSFTVVVHELDSGGGVGQQYTLQISGAGVGRCAAPPPGAPPVQQVYLPIVLK